MLGEASWAKLTTEVCSVLLERLLNAEQSWKDTLRAVRVRAMAVEKRDR